MAALLFNLIPKVFGFEQYPPFFKGLSKHFSVSKPSLNSYHPNLPISNLLNRLMTEKPTASASLPSNESMKTDISIRDFSVVSDEPESEGGTDQGPSPVKMALGSLAACTSMTVKMYIEHKGWEVGSIQTDVYYDIKLIKDKDQLSEEEQKHVVNSRLRRIKKIIRVEGDFDDAQIKRMRIIAGKCPVNLLMIKSCMIEDVVERK